MIAVPGVCPLTTPCADTVAIAGLREVHVKVRPLSGAHWTEYAAAAN